MFPVAHQLVGALKFEDKYVMRRVVVVGTSGSGKTTLARQLAARLGVPHIELDALYWGPNWTPRDDFAQRVQSAISKGDWVVDGGYAAIRHIVWPPADTIVWLDFPMRVVFMQVLRRSLIRGWRGEMLWGGCRESVWKQFCTRESILLWVIQTWRLRRNRYPKLLRAAQREGKRIVRLRSRQDADAWLDAVA